MLSEPALLFLLAYILVAVISLIVMSSKLALPMVQGLKQLLYLFLMGFSFWLLPNVIRTEAQIVKFTTALIVGGVIAALMTIYQLIGLMMEIDYSYFYFAFLQNNESYGSMARESTYTGWAGVPRPLGTGPEPRMSANFLAVPAAIAVHLLFDNERTVSRVLYGLNIVVAGIIVAGLFVLLARTGFMALGVIASLNVLLSGKGSRVKSVVAMFVIGSIFFLMSFRPYFLSLWQNLFIVGDPSIEYALYQGDVSMRLVYEYPVLGVGYGNYGFFGENYLGDSVANAGNLYLQLLSETGVLGAAAFAAFLLAVLRRSFENVRMVVARGEGTVILRMARAYRDAFVVLLVMLGSIPAVNLSHYWFVMAMIISISRLACCGHEGGMYQGALGQRGT